MKKQLIFFGFFVCVGFVQAQGSYKLAVLKYNGGGDYYANPTSLPNLISYCNQLIKNLIVKIIFLQINFLFKLKNVNNKKN
jgi:hypothetical protein